MIYILKSAWKTVISHSATLLPKTVLISFTCHTATDDSAQVFFTLRRLIRL